MKVGNWAMLRLHKSYSISSLAGVIKKLIQQYVSPFQIKEKVRHLVYRLEIPSNYKINLVFLVVQFEPTPKPSNNPFWCFYLHHPLAMFVASDTDNLESFEINCLLNKRMIKKGKSLIVKYLICWTGYGLEWDK